MPFPDLIAAGFTNAEDSKKFDMEPIDPSMQYQAEGGVNISRKRFTRDPGFKITTGFTNLSDSDNTILQNYYVGLSGGSVSFNYIHPTTGVTYNVRFSKPFKSKYAGMGGTFKWDVDNITLQTV